MLCSVPEQHNERAIRPSDLSRQCTQDGSGSSGWVISAGEIQQSESSRMISFKKKKAQQEGKLVFSMKQLRWKMAAALEEPVREN